MPLHLHDSPQDSSRGISRPLISTLKTKTRIPRSASVAEMESKAFKSLPACLRLDHPDIPIPTGARPYRMLHRRSHHASTREAESKSNSPSAQGRYVRQNRAVRSPEVHLAVRPDPHCEDGRAGD